MISLLIDIEKIVVEDRIRKDFGNLQELADDIRENGLINPPVVTPEYHLIAGERRLRACRLLGYRQIEVRVMTVKDYEHQLRLEISENENRKEFTFSERVEWARRLERVEALKAKERQGSRTDLSDNIGQNFGRSSEIAAKVSGFGSDETYRKAKFIADHADEETIRQLDKGELSIHRAYQDLKKQLERTQAELVATKEQAESIMERDRQLVAENERLKREKNPEPKVIEKVVEVVPQKVQEQLEWDQMVINNAKADIEKLRKEIEALKLQQTDDFDPEQAKIKRQKLQMEADISTLQLKVYITEFLKRVGVIAFMDGALAAADPAVKRQLTESIKSLEAYLAKVKSALNSRIVVEDAQYREV
ncbi:hypothetical protein GCM10025857_15420 [Alicyclobacillus contaminans]|nr:hypothetical protein GCM10025857_15420 [Alicyclobacillus contaminans]